MATRLKNSWARVWFFVLAFGIILISSGCQLSGLTTPTIPLELTKTLPMGKHVSGTTIIQPTITTVAKYIPGEWLSFQVLEQADAGYSPLYEGKELALALIGADENTGTIENLISATALARLDNLDFDEYPAVIVFQGLKPTGGFGIEVREVSYEENKIFLYVDIIEPQPDQQTPDVLTSPYHLIMVRRPSTSWEPTDAILVLHKTNIVKPDIITRQSDEN